jgi:hypothetical protein
MPRPPFIQSRETERAAVDQLTRDPAKRQLLYGMIDAVLRIRESGTASQADLLPILRGFEAGEEAVWSSAGGWLAKLHAFAPELSSVLDHLAHHKNATVRRNLCASLNRFPPDVALSHLKRFLTDRSRRVRGFALGVSLRAGYRQLIPDFEAQLERTTDADEREDIEQAIALLRGETFTRDGMKIRRLDNGDLDCAPVSE